MIELYSQYMNNVVSGKATVCENVRMAVQRQLNDLNRQNTPDFQYYFDEDEAERWLRFISILRHTSGNWKGQRFNVQDFQAFRWACIFGWQRTDGKGRRFRRAFVEVARKQGKTEEAAAIMLGGLLIDGENGAQIFSAATTRHQAKIVYNAAKLMARELRNDSEVIRDELEIRAHRIISSRTDSFMEALSAEAGTLDGLSPHIAVIDEFHAHPTNEVLKVLETGQGARSNPLSYIITTSGFNFESPWFHLRQNCIDILRGLKTDETFFGVIYTLDEGDDWNDRSTWVKANPQIGITPSWEFMESEYTKAVNEGGRSEVEFKTKNLNIPCGVAEVWIQDEVWQKCPNSYDLQALKGRACFAGIDFAATSDFTACVLLFPSENEGEPHILLPFFYIPEETAKMRSREFPDVLRWINSGLLTITPGNVTDYDYLIADLHRLRGEYDIQAIGYDPYNAFQTVARLEADGFPMDKFAQGIMNMSAPTKEFERLVKQGMINHGGNPIMRWMLSNVQPYYDQNENLKIRKKKNSLNLKIDGIIASVIALGEYIKNPVETYSGGIYFV